MRRKIALLNKPLAFGVILILITFTPISSAINIKPNDVNENVKIYKFARIKTTKTTGADILCFPGYLRTVFFNDCLLLHSFIAYQGNYWEGWHLTINGDEVSRGRGYIFGFTGKITNWLLFGFNPDYGAFDINGIAILIIHIAD